MSKKIPERDISAALTCYIRTSFQKVTPVLVIYQNDDLIVIVYLEKNIVNIVQMDDIDLIKPIKSPPPLRGISSGEWDILLRTSKSEWVLTGDSRYDKALSFLEVFDKKVAVDNIAPLEQEEISSKKTILFPDNQKSLLNTNHPIRLSDTYQNDRVFYHCSYIHYILQRSEKIHQLQFQDLLPSRL